MSGNVTDILHQQMASGDYEQAAKTAHNMAAAKSATFSDFAGMIQHAVNARQPDIAVALIEGSHRFFVARDASPLRQLVGEMTAVLASCWREKLDEPARKSVALVLELLGSPDCPTTKEDSPIVAKFAGWAGRFALRQNDPAWFGEIALQTAGWAARDLSGQSDGDFLPVFEFWLHRILRHDRIETVPALFEALSVFLTAETDKKIIFIEFLREWRVVAGMACLNMESPMASQLVEHLLLFTLRSKDADLLLPVSGKIGEVAALAVSRHGVPAAFLVLRALLDMGRINLGDELKFGTGPDPSSLRQRIIRLVCRETLQIADIAAHADLYAVSGDKIEEIFQCWVKDPRYESQIRSIQRFCQLLLIYWSNNRKRAAQKWTPRDKALLEPLLLTEEDQTKLAFLL